LSACDRQTDVVEDAKRGFFRLDYGFADQQV
jgi:hypothetical protein